VQVDGTPMFALTAKGYEAMARNLADVAQWMQEASWQLNFYTATRAKEASK
jgi:hypothetical protein